MPCAIGEVTCSLDPNHGLLMDYYSIKIVNEAFKSFFHFWTTQYSPSQNLGDKMCVCEARSVLKFQCGGDHNSLILLT